MDIAVISYNMSVFSAMGEKVPIYASEYSFLQRAEVDQEVDQKVGTTNFFRNALKHLGSTAQSIDAKVIGIQEFHPPTLDMITNTLKTNPNYVYHAFSKEIKNKAAVLTIWDKTVLGEMEMAYDADLGLTKDVAGVVSTDAGRPISIIKTDKGFTLINFHGINRPKYNPDGTETFSDNSTILKALIAKHCEIAGVSDPNKIIIVCDSNDREHGINRANPLMINGVGFHDGHYPRNGAKSCCYNWDSCGIPKSGGKVTMGSAGAEQNYAYTGDYVLGANLKTPVTAEPSKLDTDEASMESDHKLVYAILSIEAKVRTNKNNSFYYGGRRNMKTKKTRRAH
jgi:hypothetical protein